MTQPSRERRIQTGLLFGSLLLFLAVWKGDGGYLDLEQYLDNAESIWLRASLSIPEHPGTYYIHPLGIAVLSGPFVIAGAAIEKITSGAIGRRAVAALSIPVFSALACLLLYKIGRELNLSAAVSLWASLVLAFGSPLLSYTRLFFAESGIALSLCFAGWAFLRARHAEERVAVRWSLLAGAGLSSATACHFNNVIVSAWLFVGMTAGFLSDRARPLSLRKTMIAALAAVPIAAGGTLLYANAYRFGSPLATGYSSLLAEYQHPISVWNFAINFPFLIRWLLRVPWIIPALIFLHRLWPRERGWAVGLGLAAISHVLFFQTYIGLQNFWVRYPQTAVVVLSVGMLLIGNVLWQRWKERGLIYSGLVLILWNLGFFVRGDSSNQPFFLSPADGKLYCYVWYMTPLTGPGFGSPMGPLQVAVLGLFLLSGSAVLFMSIRAAANAPEQISN